MKDEDLHILITLYRNPNLTRTAELMYTTQPTLTRRIQQLEKEFKVQILNRSNKGVSFTPQGEYLAQQSEKILQFIEDTKEVARQIGSQHVGTIRLAVANSYGEYTLPTVLKQYQALHPNIRFDVATTLSNKALRMVQNGEADAGVIRGEFSYHGKKQLLGRDKCFVFSREPINMMDLPLLPRVTYPLSGPNQQIVDDWWYQHFRAEPTVGYHVSNLSICREMVEKGLGYGISLVEDLDRSGNFYQLPMVTVEGHPIERNTWLIQSDESRANTMIQDFIAYLLK